MIERINLLNSESKPLWGKMTVSQMLAHCAVPYEYEFNPEKYGPPASGIKKVLMRLFLKSTIAGPKPYKKNSTTAPDFRVADDREFEKEKSQLIDYIRKTQALGADHFVAKETQSIGKLTADEWNTMYAKHLDHHLKQFGV